MAISVFGIAITLVFQFRISAGHPIVRSIASSHDGRYLAVSAIEEQVGLFGKGLIRTVSLIDIESDSVHVVEHEPVADARLLTPPWNCGHGGIAFSRNDRELLVQGCSRNEWRSYNVNTPRESPAIKGDTWNHLALVSSRVPGNYVIWDTQTGIAFRITPPVCLPDLHAQLLALATHCPLLIADDDVTAIAQARTLSFSVQCNALAIQHDGRLRICDFDDACTIIHDCPPVSYIAFSCNGMELALAHQKQVRVIDISSGVQQFAFKHGTDISAIAWAAERIAVGDLRGKVSLWDNNKVVKLFNIPQTLNRTSITVLCLCGLFLTLWFSSLGLPVLSRRVR